MTRNWHLGEPEWEDRGVEGGGGYRYLPLVCTDREEGVLREYTVAKIYVDEDDPEMLEDARLIAAAPKLQLTAEEREAVEYFASFQWTMVKPYAATLRGLLERLGGSNG